MGDGRAAPRIVAIEIPLILRFIDRPQLLAELGLSAELLQDDPDPTLGIETFYDVVEAATEASGDPYLGLHFGANSHLHYRERAGAMALLILASDTVRIAIDRAWRYQRVWNEAERYEVEENGEFVVRYACWGAPRPAHVQLAEKTAAQVGLFMRRLPGGSAPIAVRFPHPRRPGSEEMAQVLGCEPSFDNGDWTEIVFAAAVADARLPSADAALFRVLDRHLAERVLAVTHESAFADRARKAISDYLHREELSIEMVAKVLHVSGRTLQRRLTAERTSFRDLLDEVRRSRALALVESGAKAADLALFLGYAEEATFYRAFRRWTGATPEGWRSRRSRAAG